MVKLQAWHKAAMEQMPQLSTASTPHLLSRPPPRWVAPLLLRGLLACCRGWAGAPCTDEGIRARGQIHHKQLLHLGRELQLNQGQQKLDEGLLRVRTRCALRVGELCHSSNRLQHGQGSSRAHQELLAGRGWVGGHQGVRGGVRRASSCGIQGVTCGPTWERSNSSSHAAHEHRQQGPRSCTQSLPARQAAYPWPKDSVLDGI